MSNHLSPSARSDFSASSSHLYSSSASSSLGASPAGAPTMSTAASSTHSDSEDSPRRASPDAGAGGAKNTICQWDGCGDAYGDAEELYRHLCDDHVGRKSTNNLCLTCKWTGCDVSCAKRDHITSHLRGE